MDVWTGLSAALCNPLCDDDELGRVLQKAALARKACPKDCVEALKQELKSVSDFTSNKLIQDLSSSLLQRLNENAAPRARTSHAVNSLIAQKVDLEADVTAWWRAFVPTTRAASPSLNDSDVASCVVATVEDRCDDSQRVGASISSTRNTCTESSTTSQAGLERFLPQSAPKRSKTSDGSWLEKFLSQSPQLLSRRSKASRSWKQGQNCGSWIRRGQRGGIGPQAQTIISNAYRNCDTLPLETRRALRAHMKPIGRSKGITFAGKMTSWLICLPTSTVENTVAHVQKTGPTKRPSLKRKAPAQATDDGDRPSGISEDGQLPHVSGQDRRCEVTVSVSGDRSTTSPSGFHNWLRLCAVAIRMDCRRK